MAKEPARKPHASESRWGVKTADELREEVAAIRKAASDLDVIIKRMAQREITEVKTDGATKLSRGIDLLKEFNTHLRVAVVKAEDELPN